MTSTSLLIRDCRETTFFYCLFKVFIEPKKLSNTVTTTVQYMVFRRPVKTPVAVWEKVAALLFVYR